MLDLKLIRDQPDVVVERLADKGGGELVAEVLARDTERRRLMRQVEEMNAERNRVSKEMGRRHAGGAVPLEIREQMRTLAESVKTLEAELAIADEAMRALLAQIPNLPHPSGPPGKSDADNVEVRRWGTPREFPFVPKPHDELGEALGLLDMNRAARIAKSRFAVLWGPLA